MPHVNSEEIKYIVKKQPSRLIKLFATDVDGVLTDAGMYYDNNGNELKKFNTHDGMSFKLLKEKGILTAIITSENTEIVKLRAKKLRSLGEEQLHFHLKSSIGKQKTILIEKSFENYSIGKTQECSSIKVNEKLIEGK